MGDEVFVTLLLMGVAVISGISARSRLKIEEGRILRRMKKIVIDSCKQEILEFLYLDLAARAPPC